VIIDKRSAGGIIILKRYLDGSIFQLNLNFRNLTGFSGSDSFKILLKFQQVGKSKLMFSTD